MCVRLQAEGRQKHGEGKVGRLIKSMHGIQDASRIWQLDYVNLVCGELGGFRRSKHSAELFHNSNQDLRMPVHGGDFCVFVRRRLTQLHRLTSQVKRHSGKANIWDEERRVFRTGADQTEQFLDIENLT